MAGKRRTQSLSETAEAKRLVAARGGVEWRRWGPYLSERQWGTVREDYSEHGNAWDYFPHDHARSRAYRWGEDGIAGFGDDQLYLCLGRCFRKLRGLRSRIRQQQRYEAVQPIW